MRSNLSVAKRKEVFMMYPHFLQIILNAKYPELVQSDNSYDIKALGPNTFVLMKQVRKVAKDVYQGIKPLEKFGAFAETEGAASPPTTTAPPTSSTAAPASSAVPPPTSSYTSTAFVAEEHVPPPKPVMRFEISDDDDDDSDAGVDEETLDEFATESDTDSEVDTSKTSKVLDEEEQAFFDELSKSASTPPQADLASTEPPRSGSPPLKRRKRDPRPGVFVSQASTATEAPIAPPTKDIPEHTSQDPDAPIIGEYVSEEEEEEERVAADKATQASGSGSSSQGPSQGPPQGPPGGDPRLDATLRLV